LKRTLTEQEYDIVHAHTPQAGILFLVACLLFQKPLLFRRPNHGTVYTVHTTYEHIKFRNRLLLIPVFAFFRRIVCCGQASIESMPAFFRRLAGQRLCAIQNGVDLERIDWARDRSAEPRDRDEFTIVSVGRIIDIKDPLSLLQAFKHCSDKRSQLVFIGAGELELQLRHRIDDLGLGQQVILPGLIAREKVYEHLFHADVFVSTSLVEGLPVAVLEAMACGCPVVLSDIPSHREIAAGTDFIPLVATGDAVGTAREICRFRNMSPAERANVGRQCRQRIEQYFDLRRMHEEYEEVYNQVGSERGCES
jgi:glycosyltransferase involved in cell wall biosynthesis